VYHEWSTIGRHGALHLRITDLGEKSDPRYSGGLEIHYRTPPEHMADDAPSHDDCWLLKCPCWHDGSSLYVRDVVIPHWQHDPQNIQRMIVWLEHEYGGRFRIED